MNILYIHGFGSKFDPNVGKIKSLSKLGEVFGFDYDFTKDPEEIMKELTHQVKFNFIDLIIGTSLGGYYASHIGARTGIPFVAINPAVDPVESLKKYVGEGTTFTGKKFFLDKRTVAKYNHLNVHGHGMILLDEGDEIINSIKTKNRYENSYRVEMFKGGNHRFEHMEESLDMIQNFYDVSQVLNGF